MTQLLLRRGCTRTAGGCTPAAGGCTPAAGSAAFCLVLLLGAAPMPVRAAVSCWIAMGSLLARIALSYALTNSAEVFPALGAAGRLGSWTQGRSRGQRCAGNNAGGEVMETEPRQFKTAGCCCVYQNKKMCTWPVGRPEASNECCWWRGATGGCRAFWSRAAQCGWCSRSRARGRGQLLPAGSPGAQWERLAVPLCLWAALGTRHLPAEAPKRSPAGTSMALTKPEQLCLPGEGLIPVKVQRFCFTVTAAGGRNENLYLLTEAASAWYCSQQIDPG